MSRRKSRFCSFALSFVLALATFGAVGEDIDIFSVDEDNNVDKPNVLIVLDNSANWAQQAQHWPESRQQGQSEVRAIKNIINQLPDDTVNVGLMEYATDSNNENRDGGYVRYHIRTMNGDTKPDLSAILDTIYDGITGNAVCEGSESRDQNRPFGDLFWDVYNYLSGGTQSHNGAGTPGSCADTAAYVPSVSPEFSRFKSPLTLLDGCRRNIIIFIGNNGNSGLRGDSASNVSALGSEGGSTSQLPWSNYTVQSTPATDDLGYSTACYDSVTDCSSAENSTACTNEGYTSCSCSSSGPLSCASQQTSKFTVFGVNTSESASTVSNSTSSGTVSLGPTLSCKTSGQMNSQPAVSCPANTSSVTQSGTTRTTVTETYSNCAYVNIGTSGCSGSKANYEPQATKVTQTLVETVTTTTTRTSLGQTGACYVDTAVCSTTGFDCSGYNGGCVCDTPATTTDCAVSTGSKYMVQGHYTQTVATQTTGTRTPPTQAGKNFMMDEWAKFLRAVGVPLPGTDPVVRAPVTTYTIDVFKDNPDNSGDTSALLFNTAAPNVGGGRYYQAKNEDQIERALGEIFAEVQAVNTAFSSASLPVSATNRAQNENQVFIGLFRPDRVKHPRWFGNMKRFQIVASGDELLLGDKDGRPAVNNLTGFLSECSASYWTTDSGAYWLSVVTDDPAAVGLCTTNADSSGPDSDLPDGPFVEKGAVAEMLRRGNDRTPADDGSGNFLLNRSVMTRSSSTESAFVAFNSTNAASVDTTTLDFTLGKDVGNDDGDSNFTEPRSTIHGDVVHSRPLPVNYGDDGIVVYYGANDGTLRAVKAATGEELWAFIAPEHFGKLSRLRTNSPDIKYPGDVGGAKKDYFFDGSFGLLQKTDNSIVWIYPSMRRGGRKIYALDVTDQSAPVYKWSKGCPNLDNDTGCDTGTNGDFSDIGQTWSQPAPAFVANYDKDGDPATDNAGESPLVIFGGGYDGCEDIDGPVTTECAAAKGKKVYVVDAGNGKLIQDFDTERSVAADVALVDIDFDSKVDYGYAVDTGGAVYRIDFTLLPWSMAKVASTTEDGRKFLFAPALLQTRAESGEPVIYVAVGTGDREHPLRSSYPYVDPILNRFYVFKDLPAQTVSELDLDGDEMLDKSTPDEAGDCEGTKLTNTDKKGWYVDLDDYGRGEQVVTSAAIAGGQVFFSTNRAEEPSGAAAACTSSLGEARGYVLDIVSGLGRLGDEGSCGVRSAEFAGGGLPPSPVIATVPVEGHGVETVCIGCGGRDSPLDPGDIKIQIPSIRRPIYWYTTGDTE